MNSCRINRSHYNDSGRSWVFSVSEKIALYGCSSLSGAEHFSLLVGTHSLASALPRHSGSLKTVAETEHALLALLGTPNSINGGKHFVILAYSLSDAGRHHSCYAELRSEMGSGAAFQRISGEMRHRQDL
jgi:hypothetical protein